MGGTLSKWVKELGNFGKDIVTPGWKDIKNGKQLQEQALVDDKAFRTGINQQTQEIRDPLKELMSGANGSQANASSWASEFLNYLKNAPDIAFNSGMTSLNRGLVDQRDAIAKSMANRGMSSSGINLDAIAQTGANRARGISALQGQKVDRQSANMAAGADFSNSLNQQNLSNILKTLGIDVNLGSGSNAAMSYGTNLVNQGTSANQNSAFSKLLQAYIGYQMGGLGGGQMPVTAEDVAVETPWYELGNSYRGY